MDQNQHPIPGRIRAQLLALGIPAAQHVPDVLAGFFPSEFNIDATGLSAADMAKVLVYLAERKVISISGMAGPTPIEKVKPGWHFCQFYRDFDHLLELVAPYIAEGLKNGEACFWVLPEIVTRKAACDAIAQHVEDVDAYLASGQLELASHTDWYFDRRGRLKSFEEVSAALLGKQDQALARGFKFLRAAGDAGWVVGTEQSKDFIDYEMKIDAAIGGTKVAALCTYRAGVTADEFVDIVIAHQHAHAAAATG